MNANGVTRSYMAKALNEKKFLCLVLHTIEEVLTEQKYEMEIISVWNEQDDSMVAVFHVDDNIFSIGISRDTVSELQQTSPYLLDRFLWRQIQKQGISFETDNYLDTVFTS